MDVRLQLWEIRYLGVPFCKICNSASDRLSSSMLCTSVSKIPGSNDASFSFAFWTAVRDMDLICRD
jgi:hypothetical protein